MTTLTTSLRHSKSTFECLQDSGLLFSQPYSNVFEFDGELEETRNEVEELCHSWDLPTDEFTWSE